VYVNVAMLDMDIAVSRGESFRDSLEHSMNPELQKVIELFSLQMLTH